MEPKWELFQGRPYGRKSNAGPRVTLGQKGVFYLNRRAFELIGEPKAVEMLFDGGQRLIGVRPSDPKKPNAFPVRLHSGGNYRQINAAAFCHHYRIRTEKTVLFERFAVVRGVLTLDMEQTTVVSKGAR
ncbi:MAG: hypothetical protein IPM59_05275 [Chloracidobacterium sp.]|nr:hypothetical protein [Chloracidobacterium sp.]